MQATRLLNEIRQLPANERLDLLNQLWAELDDPQSLAPLTDEQRRVLDQRLEEHLADPSRVVPWDKARDQVLDQL